MYNPFKPHIVKIGESYAVRRWRVSAWVVNLSGWELRDRDSTIEYYWYDSENWPLYCYTTLNRCLELVEIKPKPEMKYIDISKINLK